MGRIVSRTIVNNNDFFYQVSLLKSAVNGTGKELFIVVVLVIMLARGRSPLVNGLFCLSGFDSVMSWFPSNTMNSLRIKVIHA